MVAGVWLWLAFDWARCGSAGDLGGMACPDVVPVPLAGWRPRRPGECGGSPGRFAAADLRDGLSGGLPALLGELGADDGDAHGLSPRSTSVSGAGGVWLLWETRPYC